MSPLETVIGGFFWRSSLFMALGVLLFCPACSQEPILIGFTAPLTGAHSDMGVQGRNGVNLALERINDQGGIGGRKLRLLAKDDENNAQKARQADRDLIASGAVAIIGHMTSGQSLAALPIARKANVPLISPTTSSPLLSGKKDMFFRVHASSDRIAKALVRFARRELGISRMNTARDNDNRAYTRLFTRDFVRSFEKHQGTVPQQCTFSSSGPTNWSGVVQCLERKDPQGIMLVASALDTADLIGAMSERSLQVPVLCSGWAATRSLILHGGETVEDLYLGLSGHADRGNPKYKSFVRSYRNRFGEKPSFPAIQGYIAARVLARALESTGGSRKNLPQALTEIEDMQTLHGPLSLDRYGDVNMPVSILQIQNSTFTTVSRIRTETK